MLVDPIWMASKRHVTCMVLYIMIQNAYCIEYYTFILFYSYISLHSLTAKPKCIIDCRQRLLPEFWMFSHTGGCFLRVPSDIVMSYGFPSWPIVCSSYPPCSRWTTWTSWLQGGWAEDCVHSDRRKLPMCLPKVQAYPMATVWIIKVALTLQALSATTRASGHRLITSAWYQEKILNHVWKRYCMSLVPFVLSCL